jgi:putative methyltransferase (TIGR04325 family)
MLTRLIKVATSRAGMAARLGDAFGVRARVKDRVLASDGFINSFWGVYQSADEARADATPSLAGDWNVIGLHADLSDQMTLEHVARLVADVLQPGMRVMDLGGGFGGLYYTLRDIGYVPPRTVWRVVEVPALLPRARAIAIERGAAHLSFSHSGNGFAPDMVIAAGYMQYVHDTLDAFFAMLAPSVQHVMINKIALTDAASFWTLQNLGAANVAYRIYSEEDVRAAIARSGFKTRDRWEVPELSIDIPFHPERRVRALSGLWLQRP